MQTDPKTTIHDDRDRSIPENILRRICNPEITQLLDALTSEGIKYTTFINADGDIEFTIHDDLAH